MLRQRDGLFDFMKGGLIFLVVLGHSIAYSFPEEYLTRWDFRLIYSFHMALFIFVSGYLVAASKKERGWKWLWHRSFRLLLPYCVWSVIAKIFSFTLIWFFSKTYEGVSDVYWFLIVLFLLDITYTFVGFLIKRAYKFTIYAFVLFVGVCVLGAWIDNFWHIVKLYVLYIPFYFFGVVFSRYKEKFERFFRVTAPLVLLLYIIMLWGFEVGSHTVLHNLIQSWNPAVSRTEMEVVSAIYNRVVLFLGMVTWYLIFKKIYILTCRTDVGILVFLGKYTMPIYLMHSFFFVFDIFNGGINVIWGAVLGMGGSLLIYCLVKRHKQGRALLFGEL